MRDRKSWPVDVLDVRVEESAEGRVMAPARRPRTSAGMKAPSACMGLLNCVELPVCRPSDSRFDRECYDDSETER